MVAPLAFSATMSPHDRVEAHLSARPSVRPRWFRVRRRENPFRPCALGSSGCLNQRNLSRFANASNTRAGDASVDSFDGEGRVDNGALGHDLFPWLAAFRGSFAGLDEVSAEPVESAFHMARRLAIQCSAILSAFGSTRQVRVRPTFSDRIRPLPSRTARCWTTADSDMSSGSASSLTDAGPRLRRSSIMRRPASARAWYMRSSCRFW